MSNKNWGLPINPIEIHGNWNLGWVLDIHTHDNSPIRCSNSSRASNNKQRTALGQAIYMFKYQNSMIQIEPISYTFSEFIQSKNELKNISAIIPASTSNTDRNFNPVESIAMRVGTLLNIQTSIDYLLKIKETVEMKLIFDKEAKRKVLEGAFKIADLRYQKRQILLIDDLIDTGETLTSIVHCLRIQGLVEKIFVIVATATRSFFETTKINDGN